MWSGGEARKTPMRRHTNREHEIKPDSILRTADIIRGMRAANYLPDVQQVLEERGEPAYRLEQAYLALTRSLVRDWEEATNLPRGLRAGPVAKDLRGRPAALSR